MRKSCHSHFARLGVVVFGHLKLQKSKKNSFKNNNFLIKIVSPKIGIERFYHTENEEDILQSLIKLSKPNKDTKTIIKLANPTRDNVFKFIFMILIS